MSVTVVRTPVVTPDLAAQHTNLDQETQAPKPMPVPVVGWAKLPQVTFATRASTLVLADKVRAVYDSNPRARDYINRLVDGVDGNQVRAELDAEVRYHDRSLRLLATQKKQHGLGDTGRSFYRQLSRKRNELAEVSATLGLLAHQSDWRRWLDHAPEEPPAHVVTRSECTTMVRGLLEVTRMRARDSIQARRDKLESILRAVTSCYPQATERLHEAWQQPAAQRGLLMTRDLDVLQTRLAWLVQTSVEGAEPPELARVGADEWRRLSRGATALATAWSGCPGER